MSGRARIESQLENAPCDVEDTEEMFWLRRADDYQSKLALGNALSAQYRFREAVKEYEAALRIRNDDPALYNRLGGAYLTIRNFGAAYDAYMRCTEHGGSDLAAYPLGIWHYLREDHRAAAERFEKCLPCGDELAIAVIYWHCLCCLRSDNNLDLLKLYRVDMNVGHHTAYRTAVSLFARETDAAAVFDILDNQRDDLNYVITAYGLYVWLSVNGEKEKSDTLLQNILSKKSVWPCISYLAAWNDAHG
ncbi:MAG: tetratricopeptide repeat protein [Oscillospiraceae bacterium]|nr:tetratricopeptide repeat protein [Oscillospiraceae bacterium]